MIKIEKLSEKYIEQALALKVSDEQLKFVGTVQEIFDNTPETGHKHIVLVGDEVVGFFLIDTVYSDSYDFCSKESLGLRAFFIDSRHQGKGYGKSSVAALKPYIQQAYSQYNKIYLTVNCKNPSAYRCYLKNGFADTDELYLGGAAGAQYIMLMETS
jgi:RimJ/RimL family protein N-acetyltransferase